MLVLPPVAAAVTTRPSKLSHSSSSSSSSSSKMLIISKKTKLKLKKTHNVASHHTLTINTSSNIGGPIHGSNKLFKDLTLKNQCKSAIALVKERRIEFIRAKKSSSNSSSSFSNSSSNISSMEKKLLILTKEEMESFLVWKQVKKIGPGLCNLGNTCYLNSVLQCLAYTPGLVQYLLTKQQVLSTSSSSSSNMTGRFCGLKAMTRFIASVHQQYKSGHGGRHGTNGYENDGHGRGHGGMNGRVLQPKEIVLNLRHLSKSFRIGRQEDAHEFYRLLLDAMQKSCLLQQQQQHSTSTTTSTTITTMTIIHQLFGGELKNTLQCTKCGFCSNKKEIFLDLSLEIFPKKIQTLSKALEHFTCIEKLDETNQWKCSNCHQFTCAEKSLKIHTIPNILTIQLKRFDHHSGYGDYGGYGGYGGKINKHIEFPLVLDLKKYLSSKDNDSNDSNDSKSKSTKYHLYGVLVHAGYSTNCGHYYAFVKNMAGQWYEMNDEKVRWVNVDTVLQQKAYMLFYTRIIPTSSTSTKPTSTTAAPTVVVSSSSSSSSSSSTSGSVQKLTTTALPSSPSPQDPPIEMDMKSFLTSLKRQVPEEEEEKKEQGKKQKTMNNISSEEVTKAIEATDAITTTTTTFTITKDNVPTVSFAPVFTGLLGKKLHCYSSKWKPFHIQMSIQQQQQQQQQQVSISSSSSLSLPSSSSSSPPPLSLSLSQEASSCKKKKSTLSTLEFHPCLLKDFGCNAAVFGKSISKWEEDQQDQTTTLEQNLVAKQEEIISKLKKEDWHHRRKNRQDEWNESLDMGKIKKIKNKKEFIPNEGKQNAFQLVFEKKKTTTRS